MKKIRVLLVDDHRLVLRGLASLLTGHEKIELAGTAANAEEGINLARSLKPDVVVMDINMNGMSGLEASRWIKDQDEHAKIILLSMEIRKDYLSAGIQLGISGYLAKDIEDAVLFEAIEAAYEGKQYFTEAVTKLVFEDFYENHKSRKTVTAKLPEELTKRELDVLQLVAKGLTNKQVAESLFISVKTVETHKSHILDKLGLSNSIELMKYAVKNNLVTL